MSVTTNFSWPLLEPNNTVNGELWNRTFRPIDEELAKLASATQNGRMTSAMYTQLKDVQPNAEVNQNAVSSVKVGATTVTSASKTSTVELTSGNNMLGISANNTTKTITFTLSTTSAGGVEPTSLAQTNLQGRVGDSERLGGFTKSQLDTAYASTSHTHSQYLQTAGGAMTGVLTLHANPTSDLQAATKQYVDNNKPSLITTPMYWLT